MSFRATLFALHTLPPLPVLNLTLHAGLASLKLSTCFVDPDSPSAQHNPDCPVCDLDGLGALARSREVPFAHHVNSIMVCKISGKIMEGDGMEPLALPNGRVYSREVRHPMINLLYVSLTVSMNSQQALELMASKNGGRVTCPRTGDSYDFIEARKVFIS